VVDLDVAMSHLQLGVTVLDSSGSMGEPVARYRFLESTIHLQLSGEVTLICVLHEDKQFVAHFDNIVNANDVRVIHRYERMTLAWPELFLVLRSQYIEKHHLKVGGKSMCH